MSSSIEKARRLIQEIRDMSGQSPFCFDTSFARLVQSTRYRELIALGEEVLPMLAEHLRAGDIFLNDALLEITGFSRSNLTADEFASEQDIAAVLAAMIDFGPVEFYAFAWNDPLDVPNLSAESAENEATVEPSRPSKTQRKYTPSRVSRDASSL